MQHHTKDKGDLGVLKAQADLAEKGHTILLPLTEHAPFDLVIYKDGIFKRVQVKYRAVCSDGSLFIPFKNNWADQNGLHTRYVDKSSVDVFCVYCPDTDQCYYFDPKKFGSSVKLRLRQPGNNAKKGIHFAENYQRVP